MKKIYGGLLKTEKEDVGFSFGAVFGYLDPSSLPYEYDVGDPIEIKNQNIPVVSYTCVPYSDLSVSEYQEGVALEPAFALKQITELTGDIKWINIGTTLKVGAEAMLKGALERKESPFSVEKDGVNFCADPNNWNKSYDNMAEKHAKSAYFWIGVSNKLTMFDAIRSALYQFRNEKRAAQAGIIWNNEWSDLTYIDKEGTANYGHAIAIKGWKGNYLKIQNSLGKDVGDNGIQYFHKEIVNKLFSQFKALMFADMPENETKENILKKSKSYRNSALQNIIDSLSEIINQLIKIFSSKEIKVNETTKQIEVIEKNEIPKYLWATPKEANHSVRVICDEEGLRVDEKNLICQVINCESGFNINALHINNGGTGDYGICQYNSYWYIGEGKPIASIDEALNNPEKCVRVMIKEFKAGRLRNWVCYLKEMYKKYPSKLP